MFATVNGVTLHYETTGDAKRQKVIVFANSLGSDFRIWRDVVTALSSDYATVCYDKRGHGLSDLGHPPYIMADHIGDLTGLLDHLGIKNAILCGLSVGGMIAIGTTARRPDLVRALILCDTGHKIGNDETWNGRIRAVSENGIASISGMVLERWFTSDFRTASNPVFAGARNMLERQPVAGYAGTCAAIRDADFTQKAKALKVPVLCVVGDQDGATPPELVQELADLIPGSRYEVIADAGHIPCVEQPARLVSAMRSFLAGI